MTAAHTPGPRAQVRVYLTNPTSGYESETETTVSPEQWAVIDAVLCGRGQPYASAPDLAETGSFLLERLADFERTVESESGDAAVNDWHGHVVPAIARFRAAIAKATGQ